MAKYRLGFVSNSSSSSFVCDVCGEEASGWDMDLSECEMFECENGHIICNEHMVEPTQEWLKDYLYKIKEDYKVSDEWFNDWVKNEEVDLNNISQENIKDFDYHYGSGEALVYGVPECLCPLCNFEELCMEDAMQYLLKTTPYTEIEVFEYIKSVNKRRKKLRPEEYVEYVCSKLGKNTTILLKEIDERFEGSYKKFLNFIR